MMSGSSGSEPDFSPELVDGTTTGAALEAEATGATSLGAEEGGRGDGVLAVADTGGGEGTK